MILFAGHILLFAQNRSINFEHGTWAEVVAKATKANKPIFVDAYTTWCGPCKWLAKNVFTNDSVADYFNTTYVSAKIDMEKGEGIELAKKWNISAYPTLLYFNSAGELIHRTCGADMSANGASAFLNQGKDAIDPGKQFGAKQKKYEAGTTDPEFLSDYVFSLASACLPTDDAMKKYFTTQDDKSLTERRNWKIIYWMVKDIYSREFKYLVSHAEDFSKLYTKDSVNRKIEDTYGDALLKLAYADDKTAEYEALKKEIQGNASVNGEKIILDAELAYYKKKKDWVNYGKTADLFVDKYLMNDAYRLNDIAWAFYEHIEDKVLLEKATRWAKHSMDLQPDYAVMDTYAALLYKTGKKQEAKVAAEKAIEQGKKENADYKGTEDLLKKISEMK